MGINVSNLFDENTSCNRPSKGVYGLYFYQTS